MRARLQLVAVGVCALLAGCGTPGAPQPPSLELPAPVQDLAATRVGDKVTLTWTPPQRTTDGVTIRRLGPSLVCRGLNSSVMLQCAKVGEVPPAQSAAKPEKAEFTDSLPPDLVSANPSAFATYAVEVENDEGRSAGLSNQVRVPLIPAPAKPSLAITVTNDGVNIDVRYTDEWLTRRPAGSNISYEVFRQEQGHAAIDLGPASSMMCGNASCAQRFTDTTFQWGTTYTYSAIGVASSGVKGEPSDPVTITPRDTFPPATPAGLQAVASGAGQPPFIDLTWAPNTDSDLAGYNVYRHEEGQAPLKLNDKPAAAPAYRDGNVERGHKYFYAVSAVDLRGNESAKSGETSESVP